MLSIYNKYKVKKREDYDKLMRIKYKNILDFFDSLDKDNIPNILIYGEEGSCKKTLIYNFFNNIEKVKKNIEYKINYKNINFFIYYSNDYIEIDLSQFGKNKKLILIEFIKDINTTRNINNKLKIIIIHSINLLGLDEQFILRKLIEQNYNYCRFILITNTINNIIEPIKSRCFIIKTPGFTKRFLEYKVKNIIENEKIDISEENLNKILEISNKNLKKALLELDFYNNLKKNNKEDEYLIIKENNKELLVKEYIKLVSKKNLLYDEIDNILYKILFEVNIDFFTFIKYVQIILEKSLNNNIINSVIDLNFDISLNIKNNITKNKYIIFLQEYSYKLNEILLKNK